jgi:hypothetical protein
MKSESLLPLAQKILSGPYTEAVKSISHPRKLSL